MGRIVLILIIALLCIAFWIYKTSNSKTDLEKDIEKGKEAEEKIKEINNKINKEEK